jgi:hypothetical protein
VVGQRITVRVKHGEIALALRADPSNRLTVERLNLLHKGVRVRVTPDGVAAITPSLGKTTLIEDVQVDECAIGVNVFGSKIGIGFQAKGLRIGSMVANVDLQKRSNVKK